MSAFVRTHPVLSYYVLTIAISWGAIILVAGPNGFLNTTGSSPRFVLIGFSSLLGPTLAGLLLTGLVAGRTGFRDLWSRLRRWRVSARWYAIALLTAPLVNGAVVFGLSLASDEFLPGIVTSDEKLALVLLGVLGGVTVPFFEELGWTGFAMPRLLQRHSVLATGLFMGLLWGLWHLPLFAGNASSSGSIPPALLVTTMLFAWLVPYRVLMVWLYHRTRSLLLVMLMHVPIVVSMYVLGAEDLSGDGMFISLLAYGAALWLVVAGVALAHGGRLTVAPLTRTLPEARA
jgi:membrane protease YdiL (CAAX protease family)